MNFTWTREPKEYSISDERISITTEPYTDLWQRTYYHFRNDNAPVLQMDTEQKYFSFTVRTDFSGSHHRFDQCGIVMYLDSENWLKGSVEYENESFQHLGSVVTNHGYSDWATTAIPADVKEMWYRFSRREDDYCIECSPDGKNFSQMRVCHMWEGAGKISFGVYACSPENSSFTAVFTDFGIGECMWKAHDGQKPDEEEKPGYQIIQMNQNTWRIEEEGVRFFLLTGTEKALLIDSGMQVHNAKDIAETLTALPLELLNTHADMDHTGSNEQFETFYMHPDELENYKSSGKSGQLIPVREGDEIDLGNRKLRIVHLPGHTPGSIAVLDIAGRVLISGDPVQEHGRIFMFGEQRNMKDYIGSLKKLKKMSYDFDELWPSHADIPVQPNAIERLLEGAGKIMNKETEGKSGEFFGRKITAYDLGHTVILCDE